MKKKGLLIAFICIVLIFLGALISRDLLPQNIKASSRTIGLDSIEITQNDYEDSCETLCSEAYCGSGVPDESCAESYNTCVEDCGSVSSSLER